MPELNPEQAALRAKADQLAKILETAGAPKPDDEMSEPPDKSRPTPPSPTELAGHFPQLEIIEFLGAGGMGMVYKARQPHLDRLVALKIMAVDAGRDSSFAERFSREARALAKLNHPGIVAIYDFGQTRDYYYFVMEYVNGTSLRQLLQQPLEPRQALELVTQICVALQFAHDAKIVHRDIKPENILITKKGQVKIADFGLANLLDQALDTALTGYQAAMGTFNYMAPEQRRNSQGVDHRADIYSLGVVFYEMLTGEVPMGRFEPPSKRVQVDVRLDEVVLRALERDPALRYQKASEAKTAVESITQGAENAEPQPSAPTAPKRIWIAWTSAVLAVVVLAFVGWWLGSRRLHQTATDERRVSTTNVANTDQATVSSTNGVNTDQPTVSTTNGVNTDQPTVSTTNGVNTDQPTISSTKDANTNQLSVSTTNGLNTVQLTDSIPFAEMSLIPAGSFMMGDALDGEIDATPTVTVKVSAFYMDRNLVSYGLWQSVYFYATNHGYGFNHAAGGKAENHPVQAVDWYDCVKWCNARSQKAGLKPVYYTERRLAHLYTNGSLDAVCADWTANGYRLPTEAEWEKAARGGLNGKRFPWGDTISKLQANYVGMPGVTYDFGPRSFNALFTNGVQPYTSPVGYFAPNAYGLYDMAGNVDEWCWDWYGTPYTGGNDPHGPATGKNRVVRGGKWQAEAEIARCCNRGYNIPSYHYPGLFGFRCVRAF